MKFYKDIVVILVFWNIYSSFVLIMWYQLGYKSISNLITLLSLALILIEFYLFRDKLIVLRKKHSNKTKIPNFQFKDNDKKEMPISLNNSIIESSNSNFILPQLNYDNFFNLRLENIHDLD